MTNDAEQQAMQETGDHAWAWFTVHANQRMQTVNFFLISAAFLMAAFGTLLEKFPLAALAVAILGGWISIWFIRLDARTRQLIKAGERAIQAYEEHLSLNSKVEEIRIVEFVESPAPGTSTYRVVFTVIESSIAVSFVCGAVYAAVVAWLPGNDMRFSPNTLEFRSANERPRFLSVWQPGYAGPFMLENGCPGVVRVQGSGPEWSVQPVGVGACKLTIHGNRRQGSVDVRVSSIR